MSAVYEFNYKIASTVCIIYVVDDGQYQPIPMRAVIRANNEIVRPGNETKWNGKNSLDLTAFGRTGILIETEILMSLDWSAPSQLVRRILSLVFDRETLATHTLTGKPSPAFKGCPKPPKGQLDPHIVQDIVDMVHKITGYSEREIRAAITTKCADENKIYRAMLNNNNNINQI